MTGQLGVQVVGVIAGVAYTAVVTFVILKLVDKLLGLRVDEEDEIEGLDVNQHGERGYTM